jgi:hypothetical protein
LPLETVEDKYFSSKWTKIFVLNIIYLRKKVVF